MNNRRKILVIDKHNKYSYLFRGFRKNKFIVDQLITVLKFSERELSDFNLFFLILYAPSDVFELLKIYKLTNSVIIASNNPKILKKLKDLECFSIIDLTKKGNLIIELNKLINNF